MKILIDVDELKEQGVLTEELARILQAHAVREVGSTAINVLLALGSLGVAAGIMALVLTPAIGVLFGLGFVLLGCLVAKRYKLQWGKLASIWMVIGALILAASVGILINQPVVSSLSAAFILGWVSILAESGLLIALVPFAIAGAIGGSTGYWHACYELCIEEPTITIVLFFALGIGAWQLSGHLKRVEQRLSIIFARMCVILVNFGFWIGSLWGDRLGHTFFNQGAHRPIEIYVRHEVFVLGWALALLAAGAWGVKNGRRFMVNIVATFGAIHFYTQWFEYLGLHALSVIAGGILAIALGLAFWRYNRRVLAQPLV